MAIPIHEYSANSCYAILRKMEFSDNSTERLLETRSRGQAETAFSDCTETSLSQEIKWELDLNYARY
jgi:hypothetical protein